MCLLANYTIIFTISQLTHHIFPRLTYLFLLVGRLIAFLVIALSTAQWLRTIKQMIKSQHNWGIEAERLFAWFSSLQMNPAYEIMIETHLIAFKIGHCRSIFDVAQTTHKFRSSRQLIESASISIRQQRTHYRRDFSKKTSKIGNRERPANIVFMI